MSDSVLQRAILHRRLLAIDDGRASRVVEPYAYAIERGGSEVLWCFQIAGGSVSGNPIGWKWFRLSNLRSMRPLRQSFGAVRVGWRRYRERNLEGAYCDVEGSGGLCGGPRERARGPRSTRRRVGLKRPSSAAPKAGAVQPAVHSRTMPSSTQAVGPGRH